MTDRPWLSSYPAGVPADIDPSQYRSLVGLMEESFSRFAGRTAYSFMGKDVSYAEVDKASRAFAAYLQGLGLAKGDRVAVMMPNCPQYPIAVAAILRAGLILVNVNPLYTARELEHQLKDSGAKAIVIMENFATTLQQAMPHAPQLKHIVLAAMGDRLGFLKGALVNYVLRNVKKMVPAFQLPAVTRFNDALAQGGSRTLQAPDTGPDDVAARTIDWCLPAHRSRHATASPPPGCAPLTAIARARRRGRPWVRGCGTACRSASMWRGCWRRSASSRRAAAPCARRTPTGHSGSCGSTVTCATSRRCQVGSTWCTATSASSSSTSRRSSRRSRAVGT